MSEPGSMPVVVQCKGRPETQTIVTVALHGDLRGWLANGYEFPRTKIVAGSFGYCIAPLRQVGR